MSQQGFGIEFRIDEKHRARFAWSGLDIGC
jgi:hypothetical protein